MSKTLPVELLGEEFADSILRELGMEHESPEAQAQIIEQLGRMAVQRLALEIYKILPPDQHDRFDDFMSGNDITGLRAFLGTYIPELDRFILDVTQTEYEKVKTRMMMAEQGL